MSSVRMCDGCSIIFSENAEGWATQTATIVRRDERGRPQQVSAQLDKCPNCTEMEMNRQSQPGVAQLNAAPHYEVLANEPE